MLKAIKNFITWLFSEPSPLIGAYVDDAFWMYYGRGLV